MPTLEALVDGVYRDLADEAKEVFSTLQVEDFVRGGIADLNRVAPSDTVLDLTLVYDPDTEVINQFSYDIPIQLPYQVEERTLATGFARPIPMAVEGQTVSTGYVFRQTATGGNISFPQSYLVGLDWSLLGIRIYGYAVRPLPYTEVGIDSPETGLSAEEEYSIRAFAKAQGFDMLAHDRSLFGQWQGQTNNTDVSSTQMMQMAANSKQEWDRHRGLIRTVRKYW